MANPWTRKNPLLSMMLIGANAWAGAACGIMAAQARRQQVAMTRQGAKKVTGLRAASLTGGATRKSRTPKKRRS